MKTTTVKEIVNGKTFYESPTEKVSASMRFLPGVGFEVRWPTCWSSQYYGGTCYCDSHDPYEEEILPLFEGLILLRAWGYQVTPSSPDDERVKKLRRQVEDRLRKTTSLEVVATAAFLGMSPRL